MSTTTVASPALDVLNHNMIGVYTDRLGIVKAKMAELRKEEDILKSALIQTGITVAEGAYYRITISEVIRHALDTKLIRKFVPEVVLRKAEKETTSTVVLITARKGTHALDTKLIPTQLLQTFRPL